MCMSHTLTRTVVYTGSRKLMMHADEKRTMTQRKLTSDVKNGTVASWLVQYMAQHLRSGKRLWYTHTQKRDQP